MNEPSEDLQSPTLHDVAERAGVSVSTASRALSGKRRVQPELIDRVRAAAREVGYQPNRAARSLRTSKTMDLGLAFRRLETPAVLDLLDGIGAGAQEAGYGLLMTSARGDIDRYRETIRHLFERRIDGLMLVRPVGVAEELESFERARVPVLALLSRGEDCRHLPLVTSDIQSGFRAAHRRLVALGHRGIAVITGEPYTSAPGPQPPLALGEAQIRVTRVAADAGPAEIAEIVRRERADPTPATAFICEHRYIPSLLDLLRGWDLSVPRDVSVASYIDSQWTDEVMTPPLAVVHVDVHDLGAAAARVMTNWLAGTPPPPVTMLDLVRFIERPSVGSAPAG